MNALPNFKTLTSSSKEDKALKWFPKTSLSLKKDWSFLGVEADDAVVKQNAIDADRSVLFEQKTLPPNERYSTENNYSSSDPSPIGSSSRSSFMTRDLSIVMKYSLNNRLQQLNNI